MKKICNKIETGCALNCMSCEIPTTEPEGCEHCMNVAEENDVEYEFNMTHINGYWQCQDCKH